MAVYEITVIVCTEGDHADYSPEFAEQMLDDVVAYAEGRLATSPWWPDGTVSVGVGPLEREDDDGEG